MLAARLLPVGLIVAALCGAALWFYHRGADNTERARDLDTYRSEIETRRAIDAALADDPADADAALERLRWRICAAAAAKGDPLQPAICAD